MSRPGPASDLVASKSPVDGLPRRQLPLIPVFAQSVAAVAPSGAAAVIPALVLANSGGAGATVAFAAAAAVILLVSTCLRPMAQRLSAVGGIYTYTARGLGPVVAVPTGWSAIIGYASVGMSGLVAVSTYLPNVLVSAGITTHVPIGVTIAVLVATALLSTMIMVRGIRISAWVTLTIECISIVLLGALLAVVLVAVLRGGAPVATAMRWDLDGADMALSVVVAVSAFVGFESATTLGGEARQPLKSVPLTIRWTPVIACVLYLAAVPVLAIALAEAPEPVRQSPTPFVALLASQHAGGLSVVLDLAIAASFFACTLASINAAVRVVFCMGREGVAPAALGRTHPRFQTPAPAIVAVMVVVTAVPIAILAVGTVPDAALTILLGIGACGYLGSYLAGCVAAPVLLRRINESTRPVIALSALTTLLVIALLATAGYFAATGGTKFIAVYGVMLLLAVLFTLVLKLVAPHRLADVGIYDETQRTDLLSSVPVR